ncbi:uncharacterized protein LOC133806660 [Humulus lupulus]|uniref:uncharacterized protein LOC133806660 n=1 Tax=Humulus lupulus TaxID=3486 RepID=UPI002B40FFE1|nr:uncharacterized protein LOC133806660 [Humulus lupulus]
MLNNRPQGNFPSNTKVNPKEQCQAITLKSEVFKKLHINIPFAEALEQMPSYVKFMKEILSKKRKMKDYETVAPNEEYLGLGEARPTTVTLQLVHQSVKHPHGIIKDVLVKVDKFIFPTNFIDLDMEEDANVPIILGRPFLATGQALIDVQKGELKLQVQGDEVVFNVFKAMMYLRASDSCYNVDVIDNGVSKIRVSSDALEAVLIDGEEEDDDVEMREYVNWINSYQLYRKKFEELAEGPERPLTSIQQPPQLELKALPDHLCYAYLGENETLPVIVSADLSKTELEKLLRMVTLGIIKLPSH